MISPAQRSRRRTFTKEGEKMCELFGFSSEKPTDIKALLKEFFSHSVKHPHGWGILYDGTVAKGCEKACESAVLSDILERIGPQTDTVAHIRFATVGSIKPENSHPFKAADITGREWTLIHNGTIYSGSKLIPYLSKQTGDTDSERVFLYLIDRLNDAQKERPLSAKERFELIDSFIKELSPRNKLNLMIYDGELLYVHKNMNNTLMYLKTDHGYIFSTEKLSEGEWQEIPLAKVRAYKKGKLVFEGKAHDGVFVATLQYIKAMDAMNI